MHGSLAGINGVRMDQGALRPGAFHLSGLCARAGSRPRLTELICRRMDRRTTTGFFQGAQIAGGGGYGLHARRAGWPEVYRAFSAGRLSVQAGRPTSTSFAIPLWLMVLCSAGHGAWAPPSAATASSRRWAWTWSSWKNTRALPPTWRARLVCLLSSVIGLPVSTTHTKTTAIMGVGAAKRLSCGQLGRGKGDGAHLGADLPRLRADRLSDG